VLVVQGFLTVKTIMAITVKILILETSAHEVAVEAVAEALEDLVTPLLVVLAVEMPNTTMRWVITILSQQLLQAMQMVQLLALVVLVTEVLEEHSVGLVVVEEELDRLVLMATIRNTH